MWDRVCLLLEMSGYHATKTTKVLQVAVAVYNHESTPAGRVVKFSFTDEG